MKHSCRQRHRSSVYHAEPRSLRLARVFGTRLAVPALMSTLRASLLIAFFALLAAGMQSTAIAHTPSVPTRPSASPQLSDVDIVGVDSAAEGAAARYATEVLGDLQSKYRYLGGVTVSLGSTPQGEQAIAYYTEGRIVISRTHTVDIATVLAHEIWHVIDWRDNGRIDWGENLPPFSASDYATGKP